jgi:hypothetical protein
LASGQQDLPAGGHRALATGGHVLAPCSHLDGATAPCGAINRHLEDGGCLGAAASYEAVPWRCRSPARPNNRLFVTPRRGGDSTSGLSATCARHAWMKASRSGLMTSAWVVSIPCE